MYKDAWALRAVEAAYATAVVAVALAVVNAGVCTHACRDFASWWASQADGMFAIEIYEITTELPRLNRGDLPLPPARVSGAEQANAASPGAASPAAAPSTEP